MFIRALLAAALLLGGWAPAATADRTAFLLQELDQCDPTHPETYAPKLGVLLALADGRSALEFAGAVHGPRQCIGHVGTFGEGPDELIFVGGLGAGFNGALLWVDRGYWRTAAIPVGFFPGTQEVRRSGTAREFFTGLTVGGSAGTVGVAGVRLVGATATVTLRHLPGGEISEIRLLDSDHLYVAGRLTTDALFTWMSHPAWPYGAQWMFERRDDMWVAAAHRQSRDPEWLMTGFVGALLDHDTGAMRRFATDAAVAEALDLPTLDRRIDGLRLLADRSFTSNEWMSWEALPPELRTASAEGPVYGYFTNYDTYARSILDVGMRFDRVADGWTITAVSRLGPLSPREPGLAP